jgi:hypothetical protein
VIDRETERRSIMIGWALFALVIALFAGSVGVALLYLALD